MGIELYPKFLSLTEIRRYRPPCEAIVAKCCQNETEAVLCVSVRSLLCLSACNSNDEAVGFTRPLEY
jgi:hypothetical protein